MQTLSENGGALNVDEISSPKELEQWLEDKPKEWAHVITLRYALRILPVLDLATSSREASHNFKNQLTLGTVRASLLSEVAAYSLTPETEYAAAYAVHATSFYINRATPAAGATLASNVARAALRAAYSTGATDAVDAAGRIAYTTAGAPHTGGADTLSALSALTSLSADATRAALNHDLRWLQSHEKNKYSPKDLLLTPLWQDEQNPLLGEWRNLKHALQAMDPNWQFWTDWYQAKLDGTLHPGHTQSQQENLYYQIATYPNELWELGAEVVNQRITQLMEEIKKYEGIFEDTKEYDFFLSYSTKDEHLAALIADIILQKGYSVFAQFNDMPVGSNFITEMQEGLENSSRFICLYSEDYWASDYCQQEWNAAITYDPRGKERKIVPFLISEYAIPPLARPLVYKNLIGLNNEEFQKAVLEAIENDSVITSEQARMVAKDTISPEPYFNDDQELDIRANEDYDQHRVTEDLYNLPDEQITLIDNLLDRIKDRNIVPQAIVFGFEQYRDQLVKGGVQPNISLLNNLFKLIELDIETSETDEWKSKQTDFLFEQIGENHTKFQTHFPLDMVREENYRDAPMEVDKFNEDSFYKQIQSLNKIFKELKQEQMATDRFLENRQYEYEQIQQLLNLDATRIIKTDENAVIQSEKEMNFDDYKKRRLIQVASFADKLSDVLDKSDKVIKSPTTKFLSKMAKDLADWLWK